MIGYIALALYAATVPAANWMIGNVGECVPNGPCLIHVGFGLMAPSGVLMIGAALVLRDAVHRLLGWKWAVAAIGFGAALSLSFSHQALVIASVTAFILSEFADLAIYAPLQRNRLALAVLLSGVVGAAVDSSVFLFVAFGSLDFIAGQFFGKLWVTLAATTAVVFLRHQAPDAGGKAKRDDKILRLVAAVEKPQCIRACTTNGGPNMDGQRWVHMLDYNDLKERAMALCAAVKADAGGKEGV